MSAFAVSLTAFLVAPAAPTPISPRLAVQRPADLPHLICRFVKPVTDEGVFEPPRRPGATPSAVRGRLESSASADRRRVGSLVLSAGETAQETLRLDRFDVTVEASVDATGELGVVDVTARENRIAWAVQRFSDWLPAASRGEGDDRDGLEPLGREGTP